MDNRIIMHIDFDYFYAQCEEIRNPVYKGRPIVVCVFSRRTDESGVVSTANYAARDRGVKSGIPIKLAKSRLAGVADSVFLPVDMGYYSEVSEAAMSIIESFGDMFEQAGIDECYIDVSRSTNSFDQARTLASQIKTVIKESSGLTCSVGVAPNKMLAKIASDFRKPDGLTVIEPDSVRDFIAALSVDKISGIGPKTRDRLSDMGVNTISQLAELNQFKLIEEFGKKTAEFIYNSARGIDNDIIVEGKERKQIMRILTLKNDASTSEDLIQDLSELCKSLLGKATSHNLSFRTVAVLLILNNLDQRSKSKSLKIHINSFEPLYSTARALLNDLMASQDSLRVRRLGVRVSDLQNSAGQNTMSQFMGD